MGNELTSAQRKSLRSAGRSKRPEVSIGKAGINDNVLAHIRAQLARRELLKVRLTASDAASRADAADEIADRTGATLVDLVGRNAVLYKPSDRLPKEARIGLPG